MIIKAGSTNISVYYYIVQDASATSPGEPVTGLLFSDIETGGSASYARQGAARVDLTLITLASASATHADGGFILVDDTNMPGLYRCDYPDAAFVTGVDQVMLQIVVASANNAVASPIFVDIDDNVDQTGDSFARLGAPAGASVSADIAVNNANIDILLDALIMQTTTIDTLSSQVSFTLTAGSADNNAYSAATIVIVDSTTGTQKAFGSLSDYIGSTKTVSLAQDPGIFTMAAGDIVHILPSDAFAIIDRVLTGSTHNVPNSFGKRVRDVIDSVVIFSDTAVSATINTITLSAGASSDDGAYDPADITIVGGTGSGQSRGIFQYDGTTKTAVVDRNWKVTPDGTSFFTITTNAGREHVNEGLAQAGTANTITLNTLASSVDGTYVGQIVFIRSGTGDDQVGTVTAYNGTTKVATLDRNWGTTPDTTSAYAMLPASPVELTANAISAITTDIDANSSQLATIIVDIAALPTAAEVNAEMVDVMEVDTHAEPSSTVGATATMKDAMMWNKTMLRNKMTQTATTTLLRNDGDSGTISTSTVSDDSTTFIRGKF